MPLGIILTELNSGGPKLVATRLDNPVTVVLVTGTGLLLDLRSNFSESVAGILDTEATLVCEVGFNPTRPPLATGVASYGSECEVVNFARVAIMATLSITATSAAP